MERLRAQIMQQDQSGIYRTFGPNGVTINTNVAAANASNGTGAVAQTSPTMRYSTSEASQKDHFGHPDGVLVGTIFDSRKACYDAKVHRASMKGIVGTVEQGAFSVVVNEGYEDDIDEGDLIWYTGAGGQDNSFGGSYLQTSDQSFENLSNRILLRSTETRYPVRVIRGSKGSVWGPLQGYRYDGLYDVVEAGYAKGKSGYRICRFLLRRRPGQTPLRNLPR